MLCIGSRYKFTVAGKSVCGIVEGQTGTWGSDNACVEVRKDGSTELVEVRGRDVTTAENVGGIRSYGT